jgi:hypothetical protein
MWLNAFLKGLTLTNHKKQKKNFNFFLLLNIRDFEVPLHQKQNKCNFKNIVKKKRPLVPNLSIPFFDYSTIE